MVLQAGNDPASHPYQGSVLPLYYRSKVAGPAGIEPTPSGSKPEMISISPRTGLIGIHYMPT
jgi:hypothetical protein